jgi:hypothetical protein
VSIDDLVGPSSVGAFNGLSERFDAVLLCEAAMGGLSKASVCAVALAVSRNGEGIGVCKYAFGGTDNEAVGIVVRVRLSKNRGLLGDKNDGGMPDELEAADGDLWCIEEVRSSESAS